jgi:hypothetical protein
VVVTAQAGGSSAAQVFSWQVSSPVSIASSALLVTLTRSYSTEGQAVSLQVQATDSTSGTTLQYSAVGLPLGLSINSTTGLIGGTILAGAAAAGPYRVTLSASDGTSSASVSFWWQVSSPVTLSNPGTQSATVGQSVSLALLAGNATGGALTYSAANLPPGLSINASTGVISGTPASADQGSYEVTVSTTDGTYSTSTTFTWEAVNPQQTSACGPTSTSNLSSEQAALVNQLVGTEFRGSGKNAHSLTARLEGILGGLWDDRDALALLLRDLDRSDAGIDHGFGKFIDGNAIDPGFAMKFPGLVGGQVRMRVRGHEVLRALVG